MRNLVVFNMGMRSARGKRRANAGSQRRKPTKEDNAGSQPRGCGNRLNAVTNGVASVLKTIPQVTSRTQGQGNRLNVVTIDVAIVWLHWSLLHETANWPACILLIWYTQSKPVMNPKSSPVTLLEAQHGICL